MERGIKRANHMGPVTMLAGNSVRLLVIDDLIGRDARPDEPYFLDRTNFSSQFGGTDIELDFCTAWDEFEGLFSVDAVEAHLSGKDKAVPGLVLLDLAFGEQENLGYDILRWLSARFPEIPVVILSKLSPSAAYDEAIRLGAIDYIAKPIRVQQIRECVQRYAMPSPAQWLVGSSSETLQAINQASRAVQRNVTTVLIQGASGTQRRLLAEYIYRLGADERSPLTDYDLSEAAPFDAFLDGYLGFGGGMAIVTQLASLSRSKQLALARKLGMLQQQDWRSASRRRPLKIVTLSESSLIARVKSGQFDSTLYELLSEIIIQTAPFSEASDDIPLHFQKWMRERRIQTSHEQVVLSRETMGLLRSAEWPNNGDDVRAFCAEILPDGGVAADDDAIRGKLLGRIRVAPEKEAATQYSDVDEFLNLVGSHREAYSVHVDAMELTVLPGVFSPRYSHSAEFLIKHLQVPPGANVLDMGCGTGVLGLAALRRGAGHCTFVDINPLAVKNAQLNIDNLGYSRQARVLLSNAYDAVEGKFDIVVTNPPFWDRHADTMLERSCFDENYEFTRKLLIEARHHVRKNGKLFMVMSSQSDMSAVNMALNKGGWIVENQYLEIANSRGGDRRHVRIVWVAALGDDPSRQDQ
jgi:DNA-binding NtrC family response regulator/16S rRNA G966 N2-methylase RsmD